MLQVAGKNAQKPLSQFAHVSRDENDSWLRSNILIWDGKSLQFGHYPHCPQTLAQPESRSSEWLRAEARRFSHLGLE